MAIVFIRIDDRIIHGQIVTRWAMENPCDGILAVNDEAANSAVLKSALKSASTTKTLIYTLEQFQAKIKQACESEKKYFLITKDPKTLLALLKHPDMNPVNKSVNVGPQSAKAGTININMNADILPAEADAFDQISQLGYDIEFRLVPDSKGVNWDKVKDVVLARAQLKGGN
ncbi:MAG: PTS system mannose/fructose/N-acetylgalactosamine-transporter subunit IIB [Culicoidibacterales bacterium]